MSRLLSCPHGHQWDAGLPVLAADQPSFCPVCGAAGQVLSALNPSPSSGQKVPTVVAAQLPPPVADVKTVAWPRPDTMPQREPPGLPVVAGYEVLAELGHGGMGVVYKARHLRLNRLVALKMVLAGALASPQQRARLYLEAEALADLQHPHIVQVFEVGEHEHCPYLALELVDGGSLEQKLAHQPQPAALAAETVETLARAMHAAHQRGIVHRDLKPGNVLLAADGTLKITDFGLAKRLEAQGQTQTGAILGTPNYMAPEQAVGMSREVGPLADVYALGAILYEMLTGQPPFRASTPLQVVHKVIADEPVALRRLQEKVPRDLETICLKCLHKVPQLRYASAWELAEDLRRFRAGEPIQARPVSRAERASKWVKRRPTLAALVLLCALAALGLVAGGVWHNVRLRAERDRAEANYKRAEKNFERARRAVEAMLTEVAEEQLASEPRMERKRRALLEKALSFYQEFLQERGNDAALLQATALAHKRVGDIARLLRLDAEAETAYGQAIALLTPLTEEFPTRAELRQQLADSHNWRGEVLRLTDRPAEAEQAYDRALRIQRQLVEDFFTEPDYRRDQAQTLYNLGILSWSTNRPEKARKYHAAAIEILEELAAQNPHKPKYRQYLARGYLNQGSVLRLTNRFDKAQASYDRATSLLQQLQQKYPDNPEYQHELGVTQNNLGNLLADDGRYPEAGAAHQNALNLFRKLVDNFPSVPVYRKELANTHNSLGFVRAAIMDRALLAVNAWSLIAQAQGWKTIVAGTAPYQLGVAESVITAIVRIGEHAASEAEQHFIQARKLFGKLASDFADVPDYQIHLARTLGNLAWLRTERKDWTGARPLLEEAVGRLQVALKGNPENREGRQALHDQYHNLAETLVQLPDHAGAAAAAVALPGVLRDQAKDYYNAACFLARCIPLAEKDNRLGGVTQRQAVTDRYAGQAVEMLREAIRRGGKGWQRLSEADEAEIFHPLEGRDDFRRLRAELPTRNPAAIRGTAP
jgi:serine/threonine-protein kinase